jgi:hypothetical protein
MCCFSISSVKCLFPHEGEIRFYKPVWECVSTLVLYLTWVCNEPGQYAITTELFLLLDKYRRIAMVFYSVGQVGILSFIGAARTYSVVHLHTTVVFQSRQLITHILLVWRREFGVPGLYVTITAAQQTWQTIDTGWEFSWQWRFGFCLCVRLESHHFSVH